MKLRNQKLLIFVLVVTLSFGLVSPGFSADQEIANTIYYNGSIVTVDKDMSYAEAIAVKDGKIIAVGKEGDVLKLAGNDTQKVDLKGKTMLPGFYDGHGHIARAGIGYLKQVQLQSPPIGTVKNFNDLVKTLAKRAKETPTGEWIQGMG